MLFDKERALCRSWIDWWREHYVDNQAQRLKCKISKCPVKGYFILGPIKTCQIKSALYSYNRQKAMPCDYSRRIQSKLGKCKKQRHENFNHFFIWPKNSTRAPYERLKTVLLNLSFSQVYSRKTCACVVLEYADSMRTGQWLRGHRRQTLKACHRL